MPMQKYEERRANVLRLTSASVSSAWKFPKFPRTIASQRYVLSPQDSLTRLPREQIYFTKIRGRRDWNSNIPSARP